MTKKSRKSRKDSAAKLAQDVLKWVNNNHATAVKVCSDLERRVRLFRTRASTRDIDPVEHAGLLVIADEMAEAANLIQFIFAMPDEDDE